MALDVSAGQFVLPHGPDASENIVKFGQALQMRAMAKERLRLAQEAKKNQVGNTLKDYLNPQHYLTGDEYDPVKMTKLQALMQQGSAMAEKGADTPAIYQALGPGVAELNQYDAKAKVINGNIDKSVALLKAHKGFNTEAISHVAKLLAHHDHNDDSGEFGDLKDINQVDPGKDYVAEAIRLHPELTTTGEGLTQMVKELPKQDYTAEATTTYGGRTKKVQYYANHPSYMGLKKNSDGSIMADKNGNPVGLDVNGETVTGDDNKPMIDPETGQPFQVLPKRDYDFLTHHNADVYNNLRGQVKTHFQQLLKPGQKMPSEDSQQWELMARHILRTDLQSEDPGKFKVLADQKEAPQVMKMELGDKYMDFMRQQSEATTFGHAQGKAAAADAGYGPPAGVNTVDALHRIAQNDPEYLHGDVSEVNGRAVMDVTNMLPKAKLKYGPGNNDAYKNVFYDSKDHTFLLQKKDPKATPVEVPLKELPNFLYKVAQANGVKGGSVYVDKSLQKNGYSNGTYKNLPAPIDLTQSALDHRAATVSQGMEEFEAGDEKKLPKSLQGLPTQEGTVQSLETRNWLRQTGGASKYFLTLNGPDGKPVERFFKTKDDLEEYLKRSSVKNAPAPTPADDTKDVDAIIDAARKQK